MRIAWNTQIHRVGVVKLVVRIVTAVPVTVPSQPDYSHSARCCGSMGSVLQLGVAVVPVHCAA
jgi:hypothetical protein